MMLQKDSNNTYYEMKKFYYRIGIIPSPAISKALFIRKTNANISAFPFFRDIFMEIHTNNERQLFIVPPPQVKSKVKSNAYIFQLNYGIDNNCVNW